MTIFSNILSNPIVGYTIGKEQDLSILFNWFYNDVVDLSRPMKYNPMKNNITTRLWSKFATASPSSSTSAPTSSSSSTSLAPRLPLSKPRNSSESTKKCFLSSQSWAEWLTTSIPILKAYKVRTYWVNNIKSYLIIVTCFIRWANCRNSLAGERDSSQSETFPNRCRLPAELGRAEQFFRARSAPQPRGDNRLFT